MGRKTTTWEDTGRDCPYCGSEILQRTDTDENEIEHVTHECDRCGAQWGLKWERMRAGRPLEPKQRKAMSADDPPVMKDQTLPTWVWVSLGAVLLFLFVRLGGLSWLRLLFVPILLGLVALFVYRLGREQMWW